MLVASTGMIRSGSTLQFNMTRLLITKQGVGTSHGFFHTKELNANRDALNVWSADDRIHLLKAHDVLQSWVNESAAQVKLLYIYRDLRDVAVSVKAKFGHHKQSLLATLDKALEVFEVVRNARNALSQRYEFVVRDPESAIAELATFLGIDVDGDMIERIALECSVDSASETATLMRKSFSRRVQMWLNKLGIRTRLYDSATLLHPDHISSTRGEVGVWKTRLSNQEIAELNRRYEHWLIANEYI